MQNGTLKIGWILMLILGIYRLVMSIPAVIMGLDVNAAVFVGTTGAAIIGLALVPYKKAEKWSWWTSLVVGGAPLVSGTIFVEADFPGFVPVMTVGWILFALAIAIPAKAILGKQSSSG